MEHMPKRESERMLSNVPLIFPCCNTFYSGKVKNLSENGMFINAEIFIPLESRFEVILKMKEDILKVPVRLVRIVKSGDTYEGMGVKLLNLPEKYLELLIKHTLGSLA
jgi:hypothetical protein